MTIKEKITSKLDKFVSVKFVFSVLVFLASTILFALKYISSTEWLNLQKWIIVIFSGSNAAIKIGDSIGKHESK